MWKKIFSLFHFIQITKSVMDFFSSIIKMLEINIDFELVKNNLK